MSEIYKMKLHETLMLDDCLLITRVPGGWIYEISAETGTGGYSLTSVFVPYNNEFEYED